MSAGPVRTSVLGPACCCATPPVRRRFWDAIYVLFTYSARRSTSVAVQALLAKPVVGQDKQILRFGTFRIC